jgi:8-oxo-dGTP pyrophosphatase MutT (NUDIX family)
VTKQCIEPVTSYGIILFRIKSDWNQGAVLTTPTITSLEAVWKNIEFLLIRRKDTLGFIELLRGKYNITDIEYIKRHITGMTADEQTRICTLPFQELWEGLWGKPSDGSNAYKHEREISREKFDTLRDSGLLVQLVKEVASFYPEAEWGFPKGRRDLFETDHACAFREVFEETGISENEIHLINNLDPITETFFGSNNIHYRHKYFVGCIMNIKDTVNPNSSEIMRREIGSLEWLSQEQALEKIRPYNVEKREVILHVSSILRNYCPLFLPIEIDERSRCRKKPYESRTNQYMGKGKKFLA